MLKGLVFALNAHIFSFKEEVMGDLKVTFTGPVFDVYTIGSQNITIGIMCDFMFVIMRTQLTSQVNQLYFRYCM